MTASLFYSLIILFSLVTACAVFIVLFFISAPYGRHTRRGWGPLIPNQLGWLIMESPSAILFAVTFCLGSLPKDFAMLVFLGMWEAHYIHRAFIYPLMISDGRKKMPVLVMLLAIFFNIGNSYTNGHYLFTLSGGYPNSWLIDPRFWMGCAIFLAGFIINRWADRTLQTLREPGEVGYKIPFGGLYEWISCPNYFGEIIEWLGWAIATWSLPGLAFAVWTFANLAPRARTHHAWYNANFPAYPKERKALIPGVW
jgi:3-oxo-5-alpha-steroid 4-dehydrogenase 1